MYMAWRTERKEGGFCLVFKSVEGTDLSLGKKRRVSVLLPSRLTDAI